MSLRTTVAFLSLLLASCSGGGPAPTGQPTESPSAGAVAEGGDSGSPETTSSTPATVASVLAATSAAEGELGQVHALLAGRSLSPLGPNTLLESYEALAARTYDADVIPASPGIRFATPLVEDGGLTGYGYCDIVEAEKNAEGDPQIVIECQIYRKGKKKPEKVTSKLGLRSSPSSEVDLETGFAHPANACGEGCELEWLQPGEAPSKKRGVPQRDATAVEAEVDEGEQGGDGEPEEEKEDAESGEADKDADKAEADKGEADKDADKDADEAPTAEPAAQ